MNDLKNWLKNSGISYKIFAINIGIDQTTVYRWLNGERKPSMKTAKRIEEYTKGKVRMQSWLKD